MLGELAKKTFALAIFRQKIPNKKALERLGTNLFFALFLCLIHACSSTMDNNLTQKAKKQPDWITTRPLSTSHFIGIGSAKISQNLQEVHNTAKNEALKDISRQINVLVKSYDSISEIHLESDDSYSDSISYTGNIISFTDANLQGVEIGGTWTSDDGYYWVLMTLNRDEYYAKVNEPINNAKAIALNALSASEQAQPVGKIKELYSALEAIEGFSDELMRCTFEGRQIILNTEISRRLREALAAFRIEPLVDELEIGALAASPDSVGFRVYYNNTPLPDCSLAWSVSNNDVRLLPLSIDATGRYRARVSALSAAAGKVTVRASLNLHFIGKKLVERGFLIPSGTFIISREKPSLYIPKMDEFVQKLRNRLVDTNMFAILSAPEQADYILTGSLDIDSAVTIQRSIYQAGGFLECALKRGDASPVLHIRRSIRSGDGRSADRAVRCLQREAVEIAVKELNRAF